MPRAHPALAELHNLLRFRQPFDVSNDAGARVADIGGNAARIFRQDRRQGRLIGVRVVDLALVWMTVENELDRLVRDFKPARLAIGCDDVDELVAFFRRYRRKFPP